MRWLKVLLRPRRSRRAAICAPRGADMAVQRTVDGTVWCGLVKQHEEEVGGYLGARRGVIHRLQMLFTFGGQKVLFCDFGFTFGNFCSCITFKSSDWRFFY